MFRHVLLPTDGSELSQAAVLRGISFCRETKARLTGVSVTPEFHTLTFNTEMIEDTREQYLIDSRKHAELALAAMRHAAAEAGVECDTVVEVNDHPYEAIVQLAEFRECDLILMASHGHRGVKGLLLGSETQKVLTHSRIPVLVFR